MDLTTPQSLNRYVYVMNGPMNAVDPDGANLVEIEPCGLNAEYEFGCPDGSWFGYIGIPLGVLIGGNDGGGGGGGNSGGPSTEPNVNPSGKPPLSGETLGIPNGLHLQPSFLNWLLPAEAQCDFGQCIPALGFHAGGVLASARLPGEQFWACVARVRAAGGAFTATVDTLTPGASFAFGLTRPLGPPRGFSNRIPSPSWKNNLIKFNKVPGPSLAENLAAEAASQGTVSAESVAVVRGTAARVAGKAGILAAVGWGLELGVLGACR
jgi:hypothetical protein